MKSGTDLQQAFDPAVEFNSSRCRFRNARKDFEQRRFARAVSTYDAHDLARHYLKADIFQRPKFTLRGAKSSFNGLHGRSDSVDDRTGQRGIGFSLDTEPVTFSQIFDFDNRSHKALDDVGKFVLHSTEGIKRVE